MASAFAALALACAPFACAAPSTSPPIAPLTVAAPAPRGADVVRADAARLAPLVKEPFARRFLGAAAALPPVAPRLVFRVPGEDRWYSQGDEARLPASARRALEARMLDEDFYYGTMYGSPLAYARALDVATEGGLAPGRVFDFGYGEIGHLRLFAAAGADATGVDVDPLLGALYAAPSDQGAFGAGRVTLVQGAWPGDDAAAEAVGTGFDLVVSKNVLKNGYIHPAQPVSERKRIRLGVDDAAFVRALYGVTRPGGRVLVYNLCPAPAAPGEPYIPWADGRSPFSREEWEAAGFRVLAFDHDDSAAARAMGRALGWDADEDLEKALFALYTLLERPAAPTTSDPLPAARDRAPSSLR